MGSSVADVLQFPTGERVTLRGLSLVPKSNAAAHLGVGERTLDRMLASADPPPCHRIGPRVYFRRAELDAWHRGRHT